MKVIYSMRARATEKDAQRFEFWIGINIDNVTWLSSKDIRVNTLLNSN